MQNKRKRQRINKSSKSSATQTSADRLPPVVKNDLIEARVMGQGNGGEGVLRVEEFPLFIPGALPGELVRARVLKVNRSHGFARLESIQERSGHRQDPPCPYFGRCGGCDMQHQVYEAQLQFKTDRVSDCFARIGGMPDALVQPAIGMERPWRYRNKVQMPIGRQAGDLRVGFYRGRSHEIIDIQECLIQNPVSDLVAATVREWIRNHQIATLDREDEIRPASLRHLLIREGRHTGQVLVVLVATTPSIPHTEELRHMLQAGVPGLSGLVLNINGDVTNRVLGEQNILLWGEDTIIDTIGDIQYRISPHSFFQVNPEQTKRMYDKVVELADLKGSEYVLDLYCGAGSIALYIARHAGFVTGVEIVPEAVVDAEHNKVLNGIGNAEFIHGRSEDLIHQLMAQGKTPDLVIVDPPRKGCDETLLQVISESSIQRMIYVSCDPATLARDVRILGAAGFKPKVIQPYDNFPQTQHVETVVLLSRVQKRVRTAR